MKVSQLPYRRVTREEMTAGLLHVIERVRGARNVEEILEARAEYLSLKTEYDTAQSLSYMRYTINTVDPFYLAEKDYYDEIGPEIENLDLQYASAVLDSPFRAQLGQALSPILLRSMELQRRSMSPEIVDDMVEENKLVSEYAQLMAGMLFPFRGEQLPRPMLMKYARSADRATRRACYEALGTTLEAHSEQLDGIFDRLVHVRDRMARKMGYENFIELGYCRMERMCYDVQAVQTSARTSCATSCRSCPACGWKTRNVSASTRSASTTTRSLPPAATRRPAARRRSLPRRRRCTTAWATCRARFSA